MLVGIEKFSIQTANTNDLKSFAKKIKPFIEYIKIEIMKSLVRKKIEKATTKKVAQCCAKTSKTVVGCHD